MTAQLRLTDLMQAHLAAGGLILAATHGPIGLAKTLELQLGPTTPSAQAGAE